jgi:hypothetical protein
LGWGLRARGRGRGGLQERPGGLDVAGTEDDGALLQQARYGRNLVEGQAHTKHQSWTSRVVQHVEAPLSTAYAHHLAYRSASQGVHSKWGELTHS